MVYASAVRTLVGVDLTARESELLAPITTAPAHPVVARYKWLEKRNQEK